MNGLIEFVNGKFLDVITGRYFEEGTRLFIKKGKIEIIPGRSGGDNSMKPDTTIDLCGRNLIPGLFNVHCHIQSVNPTFFSDFKTLSAKKKYHDQQVEKCMVDCLTRGITNIRDAFSPDLGPNQNLKNRIEKGEVLGPRIQQAVVVGAMGGYLTPQFSGLKKILMGSMGMSVQYDDDNSGVIPFALDADEQQIRDTVDRAIDERGADLIKVGESLEESLINSNPITMTPKQLEAITDQARKRGVQSTIHCVSVDTFRRSVQAGFSSLAHMPRDSRLGPEDIDAFLQSNILIEPTLSVGYDLSWKLKNDPYADDPNLEILDAYRKNKYIDLSNEFWVPELADYVITGFEKASLGKYRMLGLIPLTKTIEHYCRLAHHGVENTKALFSAGAVMACGNDGGIQASTPAMVAHEIAMFDLFMGDTPEGEGFNALSALQMATINSARSMGIEQNFGSLETGKVADLVVLDADPLQDFAVIGSPAAAVFKGGNLVVNNCGLRPVHDSYGNGYARP